VLVACERYCFTPCFTPFVAVWCTDAKPHVRKHMFIILSSRIRIRVRIRGFFKNPSESVRLQDFEIRNNTSNFSKLFCSLWETLVDLRVWSYSSWCYHKVSEAVLADTARCANCDPLQGLFMQPQSSCMVLSICTPMGILKLVIFTYVCR